MKRLIASGILLIFVISAYFIGILCIDKYCDETENMLQICENEYKTKNNSYKSAQKLVKDWEKKEQLLSVFVNHQTVDEIELELAILSVFSKGDDDMNFYKHLEKVRTLLTQLREDTKINAHNIL